MAKVFFSKTLTSENLCDMFKALNFELKGKVAVKVHSGEKGNQNYLKPEFMKPLIDFVGGTVVECNTAYDGERNTSTKHKKLISEHGWTMFNVDILDEEGPDMILDIPNGKIIKKDYVGKNLKNYDSMLVISHFKGHPMGGYGGALKQLSIGVASSYGKAYIHGAGNPEKLWDTEQNLFLEAMADSASAVHKYFDGKIAYVNVMCNMSVDCDCCAVAEDPCMSDIGILSSLDPVALDQACVDLVVSSNDPGKEHLLERINSRNGLYTIECAEKLGIGSRKYELVNLD